MQISSNTWTRKVNFAAMLQLNKMHAFLSEKGPNIDTFISFNVLIYTYTVAELFDTVFLHFRSPRLQK